MKDDLVFIHHIIDEINYILKKTAALEFNQLIGDETLEKALIRSLEVIGEASKNVSSEFKEKHLDIEWKEMAGLRDKLIHFYFGVDWNILWDVIKNEIPALANKLNLILS